MDRIRGPKVPRLTARQMEFIDKIVFHGMSREDAYCITHGVNPSDFKEGKLEQRAYSVFSKPLVYDYYNQQMQMVRDAEVQKGVWTKERATEKLTRLVEHAEELLYEHNGKLTVATMNAILLPIKELNSISGLLVQKIDLNADSQITFVGEEQMLD